MKTEEILAYLRKGWGESRWKRVVRFRLGNKMRKGRYWEKEEEKECRLCGGERKSWKHLWEECRTWTKGGGGSWQERVAEILGEKGGGESWMREVEEERKRGTGR